MTKQERIKQLATDIYKCGDAIDAIDFMFVSDDTILDSHFGRIARKLDAQGYRRIYANGMSEYLDTYLVGKKVYAITSMDLDHIGCGIVYLVNTGTITGMLVRQDAIELLITFDDSKKELTIPSSKIGTTIFFSEEEAKNRVKVLDEEYEKNIHKNV